MVTFVDTSAIYAILDARDTNHGTAAGVYARLTEGGDTLVTTNYVVIEATALLQRRLGLTAVRAFAEEMVPLMDVVWVSERAHHAATAALLAANRKDLSLVDCTSFEVLREHGIRTAFCFDMHFREQGFQIAG